MLLNVKPDGGSMLITFPEDIREFKILSYTVQSKFNWKFWQGRKKFYLEVVELADKIPETIPDHNLRMY